MKKNGFTLIELLAVIIILGIIALIAVPMVSNVIEDSKKSTAEVSTKNYLNALEDRLTIEKFQDVNCIEDGIYSIQELNTKYGNLVSGQAPESGKITIANGKVTQIKLCTNGYTTTYQNNKVVVGSKCGLFGGDYVMTPNKTYKGIVYMDPTDISVECDATNSVSTTGTKTGCMKFYIFDDSNNIYKMILDHNTTPLVQWNSTGDTTQMIEARAALTNDTNGWVGNPRLMTATEIKNIFNINMLSGWFYIGTVDVDVQKLYSSQTEEQKAKQRSYSWLFENLYNCMSNGCDSQDNTNYTSSNNTSSYMYGYWLQETPSIIKYNAEIRINLGYSDDYHGVRPVIELPKKYFN